MTGDEVVAAVFTTAAGHGVDALADAAVMLLAGWAAAAGVVGAWTWTVNR